MRCFGLQFSNQTIGLYDGRAAFDRPDFEGLDRFGGNFVVNSSEDEGLLELPVHL